MPFIFFILSQLENSIFKIEFDYIEKALEFMNLEKSDLSYDKKWGPRDPFRLKIIEDLMDNPLKTPLYTLSSCKEIENSIEDIPKLLNFLASQIYETSGHTQEKIKVMPLKITLRREVESVAKTALSAFSQLSISQFDSLLYTLPDLWTDEDDSTDDYFLGILDREFGKEKDTSYKLKNEELLKIAEEINFKNLVETASSLYITLIAVIPHLSQLRKEKNIEIEGVEGEVIDTIATEFGVVIIGGKERNVYKKDFLGIIDLGGDDQYKCRAGGAVARFFSPVAFVLDLNGNDFYFCHKVPSFGAGLLGVGILYDLEGNDTYITSSYSIGAGLFGVGILVDEKGEDIYRGGFFTQGAGNFGIGILIDKEKDDVYHAWDFAQGFGSVNGYGLLHDREGDDCYYAGGKYIHYPLLPDDYRSFAQGFGIGWRDIASGGIGLLYDKEGNDKYIAEVYAQGTSYWYSLGMLYDEKGNDYYLAAEYAQGTGIHLSVGCLIDLEGEDHYYSKYGPAQGEGHDLSVGFFWDKDGNDTYYVSGGQGVGLTNSVGCFIDSRGDDTYSTREKLGQGTANWARGFGGAGIFLDLEGKDIYPSTSPGKNNKVWEQGTRGIGIDAEILPRREEPWYDTTATFPELDTLTEAQKIKKLFEYASLWEVRGAIGKVRSARKLLLDYGEKALKYVFENEFKTYSPLKLRAIEYLVEKMADTAKPYLHNFLDAENDTIRRNAIWLIGKLKDTTAVEKLIKMLSLDENKKLSATIIIALGELKDTLATSSIIPYLKDEREAVRIKAAEALGKLKDKKAIPYLLSAMNDKFFTVRMSVSWALEELKGMQETLETLKKEKDKKQIIELIYLSSKIYKKMENKEKEKWRDKLVEVVETYSQSKDPLIKRASKKLADIIEARGKLPIENLYDLE